MNQALINYFIFIGVFALIIWSFLKQKKIEQKEKAMQKKYKSKLKNKNKPWIEFPHPLVMLFGSLGIAWLVSVIYGLGQLSKIIGPFGLFFLILWLFSINKNK